MDLIDAIRTQAMLDVMEGDFLYHYRRICRWFSSKFATPLSEVEELPIEYVLQHFFEEQFESMSKSERRKIALEMTENETEKKARLKKEKDKTDDAFLKKIAKQAKKDATEKATKKKLADEAAKAHVEMMANNEMARLVPPKGTPPPPPVDLPDFGMRFDESGNLLEDGQESVPLPPPRKR
jgi:hypothetical protein